MFAGVAQEEEVLHGGRQLHPGELPQVQEDSPRGHRRRDGRGRGGHAAAGQNLIPLYVILFYSKVYTRICTSFNLLSLPPLVCRLNL